LDIEVSALPGEAVSKEWTLRSFIAAYGQAKFAGWFGELLDRWVDIEGGTTNPVFRQPVLERLLRGEGHWRSGIGALRVLGYEMTEGEDDFGKRTVVVLPTSGGQRRQAEVDKLRAVLAQRHPGVSSALRAAYEAYFGGEVGQIRQAIASCRTAMEGLLKDLTRLPQSQGISSISKDSDSRCALFKALYGFLSGRGTHPGPEPSDEDALLAIRMTEDVLVWMLRNRGEW